MVIVAGAVHVDPAARAAYLADCQELITQARGTAGCLDFHLTADPLEADRINVFEQWESVAAVEAFRGSGPSGPQQEAIRSATVWQHQIASSQQLLMPARPTERAAVPFLNVDDYIATFPADVQPVLQEIRRTIHAAVPGSGEIISYNIPTLTRDGKRYVHFAGWAKHVSLYPVPELEETEAGYALATKLEPYLAGKGTLKFPLSKPIPYDLIGRVAAALAERPV